LGGLIIYSIEKVVRFIRSFYQVVIVKVVEHPSKTIEIQMRRKGFFAEAGQDVFINVPSIAYFEWHPFTLTSVSVLSQHFKHCLSCSLCLHVFNLFIYFIFIVIIIFFFQAPEEDYFSVHIRVVGDWTEKLMEQMGVGKNGQQQQSWELPK